MSETFDWLDQIEWEEKHLNEATCIMFWIPRNLDDMPGFTTNIEWGTWQKSGKVVLGAPEEAPKLGYIRHYAKKYNIPQSTFLPSTIEKAMEMVDEKSKIS